jgi:hypothetical protein
MKTIKTLSSKSHKSDESVSLNKIIHSKNNNLFIVKKN